MNASNTLGAPYSPAPAPTSPDSHLASKARSVEFNGLLMGSGRFWSPTASRFTGLERN